MQILGKMNKQMEKSRVKGKNISEELERWEEQTPEGAQFRGVVNLRESQQGSNPGKADFT